MQLRTKRRRAAGPSAVLSDVVGILLDRATNDTVARLAMLSKPILEQVRAHMRECAHKTLPLAVYEATISDSMWSVPRDTKEIKIIRWLLHMAPAQLPSRVVNSVLWIPDVPKSAMQLLLKHGMRISYEQLIKAARSGVSGIDAWVQLMESLKLASGLPKIVVDICTEAPFSLFSITTSNVADLLHLAVNKHLPAVAEHLLGLLLPPEGASSAGTQQGRTHRQALHNHLLQQPSLVEQLLCTAILRRPVEPVILGGLLKLPAAQLLTLAAATAVFKFAMKSRSKSSLAVLGDSCVAQKLSVDEVTALLESAIPATRAFDAVPVLVQLPAAQHIPAATVQQLLQATLQAYYSRSSVVRSLLELPEAHNISSSGVEQLLHTMLLQYQRWNVPEYEQAPPLLLCQAAQQLDTDAVLRLLLTALQLQEYELAAEMLEHLPAAEQFTAAHTVDALEALCACKPLCACTKCLCCTTCETNRELSSIIQRLLQLPGAAEVEPSIMLQRAMRPLLQQNRASLLRCFYSWVLMDVDLGSQLLRDAPEAGKLPVFLAVLVDSPIPQQLSTSTIAEFLQHLLSSEYIQKQPQGHQLRVVELAAIQLLKTPNSVHITAAAAAELLLKAVQQRWVLVVMLLCNCHAVLGRLRTLVKPADSDGSADFSDSDYSFESGNSAHSQDTGQSGDSAESHDSAQIGSRTAELLSAEQLAPILECAVQLRLDKFHRPDYEELLLLREKGGRDLSPIQLLLVLPAAEQLPLPFVSKLLETAMHIRLASGAVSLMAGLVAEYRVPSRTFQRLLKQAETLGYTEAAAHLLQSQEHCAVGVSSERLLALLQSAVQQVDEASFEELMNTGCFDDLAPQEVEQLLRILLQQGNNLVILTRLCEMKCAKDITPAAVCQLWQTAIRCEQYSAATVISEELEGAYQIDSSDMVQLLLAALRSGHEECFGRVARSIPAGHLNADQLQQVVTAAVSARRFDAVFRLLSDHDGLAGLSPGFVGQLLLSCIQMQRKKAQKPQVSYMGFHNNVILGDSDPDPDRYFVDDDENDLFDDDVCAAEVTEPGSFASVLAVTANLGPTSALRLLQAAIAHCNKQAARVILQQAAAQQIEPADVALLLESVVSQGAGDLVRMLCKLQGAQKLGVGAVEQLLQAAVMQLGGYSDEDSELAVVHAVLDLPTAQCLPHESLDRLILSVMQYASRSTSGPCACILERLCQLLSAARSRALC